jgi:hypothetical protein
MQWDKRSWLLMDYGLATKQERNPLPSMNTSYLDPEHAARGAFRLCKRLDGPDAIIVPNDLATALSATHFKIWRTPASHGQEVATHGGNLVYRRRDHYAVLRCADVR